MSDIKSITYEEVQPATPSDTVDDPHGPFAGFFIGGTAGTVTFLPLRGPACVMSPSAGVIVPIAGRRILSTGTSATDIRLLPMTPYKPRGQQT